MKDISCPVTGQPVRDNITYYSFPGYPSQCFPKQVYGGELTALQWSKMISGDVVQDFWRPGADQEFRDSTTGVTGELGNYLNLSWEPGDDPKNPMIRGGSLPVIKLNELSPFTQTPIELHGTKYQIPGSTVDMPAKIFGTTLTPSHCLQLIDRGSIEIQCLSEDHQPFSICLTHEPPDIVSIEASELLFEGPKDALSHENQVLPTSFKALEDLDFKQPRSLYQALGSGKNLDLLQSPEDVRLVLSHAMQLGPEEHDPDIVSALTDAEQAVFPESEADLIRKGLDNVGADSMFQTFYHDRIPTLKTAMDELGFTSFSFKSHRIFTAPDQTLQPARQCERQLQVIDGLHHEFQNFMHELET